MFNLYVVAHNQYRSLVATRPQLADTFSWPLWAADEYHTNFTDRVRQHDKAIRFAAYRRRFLCHVVEATRYAPKTKLHYYPSFADLRVKVLGYDDTYLDF